MSCTIQTIIACDRCRDYLNGHHCYRTAKQIRASRAKHDGWVFRGGKDYCGPCAKVEKLVRERSR